MRVENGVISTLNYNDKNSVYIEALCQELRLFKGENPIDSEAGIDYLSVFQGSAFLKPLVEEVVEKYTDYFESIVVGEVVEEDERVLIPLRIQTKSGDTVSTNLEINS